MTSLPDLDQMTPEQLRALAAQLISKIDTQDRKIHRDETIIEQLTHEIAILKRHKFAKRSEQISPAQGSLLDDLLNTDLEAIEAELKALHPALAQAEPRQQTGVQLQPLVDALREAVLAKRVVHADERRYKCWRPARRKPTALMSGPTALRRSRP